MSSFDEGKAAAFSKKMINIMNAGALNTLIALGHETNLWNVLAGLKKPETAESIAAHAGLNERYVREWLGGVTTGGVVEVRDVDGADRYSLPPEHASCLASDVSPECMAIYALEMPLLNTVYGDVRSNFATGGGIPYSRYEGFQALMAEFSDKKHSTQITAKLVPAVPGLQARLESGITVCDFGCGRGIAMLVMAKAFPKSRFYGYDIDGEAVAHANEQVSGQGLTNVSFEVRDLTKDQGGRQYDLITAFDCIHDLTEPQAALNGIARCLAPGGQFLMIDIKAATRHSQNLENPMAPMMYTVSLMHCMPVGLQGGGTGLGAMWGKQKALLMLEEAGLYVEVLDLKFDSFNLCYLARKKE